LKEHPDRTSLKEGVSNNGWDDERTDYRIRIGDHIYYRYEILEIIGKGSFGQVIRAYDHKLNEETAVKVIRNKKTFHRQAKIEVMSKSNF
jgi:dual specificity tyrosine-phosphorylation-regulated kinase 2/3/4